MTTSECPMCRAEVWQDAHWRLTVSLSSEVAGFAYVEPKRHIRYITELEGPEAATSGPALARSTNALKERRARKSSMSTSSATAYRICTFTLRRIVRAMRSAIK